MLKETGRAAGFVASLLWERKGMGVTKEVEKGRRARGMARKLQKARKKPSFSILPSSSTQTLLSFTASVAPFTQWLMQCRSCKQQ